jgi:hypothetical protein
MSNRHGKQRRARSWHRVRDRIVAGVILADNWSTRAFDWIIERIFEILLAGYGVALWLSSWTGFGPLVWGQSESGRGLGIMVLCLVAAPTVIATALLLRRRHISTEGRRLWYLGIATACGAMALASWGAFVSTPALDRTALPSANAGSVTPSEYVIGTAESLGAAQLRLEDFEWTCILGIAAGLAGASALTAQLEKNADGKIATRATMA